MSEAHEQKIGFNRSQISRWKTEGWNKWGKKMEIDEKKKLNKFYGITTIDVHVTVHS